MTLTHDDADDFTRLVEEVGPRAAEPGRRGCLPRPRARREHGFTGRPGFVLVQGRASFSPTPDRVWLESIEPNWDRFLVPRSSGALGRVLDVCYWQRVAVDIEVLRVVAYPDDAARRDLDVFGAERPPPRASCEAPSGGTEPRVSVRTRPLALRHKSNRARLLSWRGFGMVGDRYRIVQRRRSGGHAPGGGGTACTVLASSRAQPAGGRSDANTHVRAIRDARRSGQ